MAYVDTSCIAALVLSEPSAAGVRRRLSRFDELVSSNFLEAELLAALNREGVDAAEGAAAVLATLTWVTPDRPLSAEIVTVLESGYVRGADCWHLATALYFSPEPSRLSFLTLDERQRVVARTLGFKL